MPLRRDGTDNLIDLYIEYVGKSEVPSQYHLWCLLSALAACVSNRVWLEKMPGKRLAPNLYVALLGPSAIGKGEAIDAMLNVVRNQRRVNVFKGKVTAPSLLDQLVQPKPSGVPWSHMFLVTPELSWSMGKGDWADMLVKQLTELYGGSLDTIRETTRTRGSIRIKAGELCINWLSGSTEEWLRSVIPADAISGGFFGRMVVVPAEYDFATRYPRPIAPYDRDFLGALLYARLGALARLTGPFHETPEAVDVDAKWYKGRPEPTDPDMYAAWKRQHDFVLKLAMLLSLADGETLTITGATMAEAQKLSAHVMRRMAKVVGTGSMTAETRGLDVAEQYVRRIGGLVPHSMLLRYMSNKGYDAESCRRIMQSLVEMQRVRLGGFGKGRAYEWLGEKKMLWGTGEDVPPPPTEEVG